MARPIKPPGQARKDIAISVPKEKVPYFDDLHIAKGKPGESEDAFVARLVDEKVKEHALEVELRLAQAQNKADLLQEEADIKASLGFLSE